MVAVVQFQPFNGTSSGMRQARIFPEVGLRSLWFTEFTLVHGWVGVSRERKTFRVDRIATGNRVP